VTKTDKKIEAVPRGHCITGSIPSPTEEKRGRSRRRMGRGRRGIGKGRE